MKAFVIPNIRKKLRFGCVKAANRNFFLIFGIIFLLCFTAGLAACEGRFFVEAKGGYFFFTSKSMSKVYDRGGADAQLSFTCRLNRYLYGYASGESIWRDGRSLQGCENTRFQAFPLSLGLQVKGWFCSIAALYFTIGPRYFFVSIRNDSHFVDKHLYNHGCGGFVNTGILFPLSCRFRIDFFGEYSYKRMSFHSSKLNVSGNTVQIGGAAFGGGLGYSF